MGQLLSFSKDSPPKYVLVPPVFDRDRVTRDRMALSSYDYLFCKTEKHQQLFQRYLGPEQAVSLYFSPQNDTRFLLSATATSSRKGEVELRYNMPRTPLSFVALQAAVPNGRAQLMTALIAPVPNAPQWVVGTHARLPMHSLASREATARNTEVGCRVSSNVFTAGATAYADLAFKEAWLVGKGGPMTAGVQLRTDKRGSHVANPNVSYALAYAPKAERGSSFAAVLELENASRMNVLFFHHGAMRRKVYNVFEKDDVIGITNYVDLAFQLSTPIGADISTQRNGADDYTLQCAASWQANKNLLIRAQAGTDTVSAAVALKAWWNPAFTASLCTGWDMRSLDWSKPFVGLQFSVENEGALQYNRGPTNVLTGSALNQRHIASTQDVMSAAGQGPVIREQADHLEKVEASKSVGSISEDVL